MSSCFRWQTWCIMQLLFFLARGTNSLPLAQKWSAMLQGLLFRCKYLAGGHSAHASRLQLTPYVVYVQKLARLMRAAGESGSMPTKDLVRFYMHAECAEDAIDAATLDMLEQLLEMRALILLIDGVDEAADLAHIVEDYVTSDLVPMGHPVVVTSRPEGVRLRLYASDFVIINLEALTKEQQQAAIDMQLQGSPFFNLLAKFSAIRQRHDDIYLTDAFPMASDRESLESWQLPDRYRIGQGLDFDPAMRSRNKSGALISRRPTGAPPSAMILRGMTQLLSSETLNAIDQTITTVIRGSPLDGVKDIVPMETNDTLSPAPAELASKFRTLLIEALPPSSTREQLALATRLGSLALKHRGDDGGKRSDGLASRLWS